MQWGLTSGQNSLLTFKLVEHILFTLDWINCFRLEGVSAMKHFGQLKTELGKLSQVERFSLVATVIGLIVDLIALASYIDFVATEPESVELGLRNHDFLVWILLAILYSLGLLNSYIYMRWRGHVRATSLLVDEITFHRLALALVTSFPFTYAYMRVIDAVWSSITNTSEPLAWSTLFGAGIMSFLVVPIVVVIAIGFEVILAAFVGR